MDFLKTLERTVQARGQGASASSSYTAKLLAAGLPRIAQKVGEEGVEIALAAVVEDDAALIGECADMIYHLSVLLVARKLSWDDVEQELTARHSA